MLQSSIATWLHPQKNSPDPVDHSYTSPLARGTDLKTATPVSPELEASATKCLESAQKPDSLIAARRTLPVNVKIAPCTQGDILSYRRLNALLLPIPYQKSFYDEIIGDELTASITRLALWQKSGSNQARRSLPVNKSASPLQSVKTEDARLVGGIRCRLLVDETSRSSSDPPFLYVSTLGVLAPFRGHGIAARLLHEVTLHAAQSYDVRKIKAHVWEANEDALRWYKQRGFRIVKAEQEYYKRLAPKTAAWVMEREVTASDILKWRCEIGPSSSSSPG